MPNSRFALHGLAPSLIHGLCAFFASNSRFMRLFQDCSGHPSPTAPSPPPSQFTVCTSRFALHGLRAFDLQCWILAVKLPNADLNVAVGCLGGFFFPRKKGPKNPPKNPPHNSPGNLFGKITPGFLQKPLQFP